MMGDSWVRVFLKSKEADAFDDPQKFWELIVSDYREIICYLNRYFRREGNTLVPIVAPRRVQSKYYVQRNPQNIITLANASFEFSGPRRLGTRYVGTVVQEGMIQDSARAGAALGAASKSKDKALFALAVGLVFARNIMCARRYQAAKEAAEDEAYRKWRSGEGDGYEDDNYDDSDLEYIENMSEEWKDELLSSLENMNISEFDSVIRSGYRLFVRGELGSDLNSALFSWLSAS